MLVLTSYYGEVRQHLEWENVTVIMLTCTAPLWLSTVEKLRRWTVCACLAFLFQFVCRQRKVPSAFVLVTAASPTMRSMRCRRSDLTADRLWRRDGGATSAAQLRGNPWHGVSYWANTEVSSCRESTSSPKFTSGQNLLHYRDNRSFC